jgi:hypothetical protein
MKGWIPSCLLFMSRRICSKEIRHELSLDPEAPATQKNWWGKPEIAGSWSCVREDGNSTGLESLTHFFSFLGEDWGWERNTS